MIGYDLPGSSPFHPNFRIYCNRNVCPLMAIIIFIGYVVIIPTLVILFFSFSNLSRCLSSLFSFQKEIISWIAALLIVFCLQLSLCLTCYSLHNILRQILEIIYYLCFFPIYKLRAINFCLISPQGNPVSYLHYYSI